MFDADKIVRLWAKTTLKCERRVVAARNGSTYSKESQQRRKAIRSASTPTHRRSPAMVMHGRCGRSAKPPASAVLRPLGRPGDAAIRPAASSTVDRRRELLRGPSVRARRDASNRCRGARGRCDAREVTRVHVRRPTPDRVSPRNSGRRRRPETKPRCPDFS